MNQPLKIALCGNPNSGKTTLFNALTGSNQKVGNWPGVTVEQKMGYCKKRRNIAVVDTPGIYSLSPFSPDEQVTLRFLLEGRPDVIIDVVDSTNTERNLFLTCQLLETDIPVVVALNMQDEANRKGIAVDADALSCKLGCDCVGISAAKNKGLDKLLETAMRQKPKKSAINFDIKTEQAIASLHPIVSHRRHSRFLAIKLLENDTDAVRHARLSQSQQDEIAKIRVELETALGENVSAALARQRYNIISETVRQTVSVSTSVKQQKAQNVTRKIDSVVLNRWAAFPIFAAVMTMIFYLSIDGPGGFLTNAVNERLTPLLQSSVATALENTAPPLLISLIADGIIGGVMSVVSFVPQIMLLFGFISVLEASGYMSRIAFITDRLLNKLGLGGRSFVSLILGCGCSVPAIMSTRTIKNANERNATVTLAPFMPCSAKLAVISFFTSYLFGGKALVAVSFYFVSILAVIAGGLVLKILRRPKENCDVFVMELPTYRAPTLKNVGKQMWERGKAFLVKAGTVIFAASVILWLLQNFSFSLAPVEAENSMLASLGRLIAPLFYPLGWNNQGCGWQFAIATLSGIAAKETVVSTLQILLPQGVENSISPLGAYSFVVYNLLTVPCMAAISAGFSEQGMKCAAKSVLFQIVAAYATALAIYQLGTLAHMYTWTFVTVLCCITIAVALFAALVRPRPQSSCDGCASCPRCKRNL